ncbi:MAG: motility-associated protein [Rhodocyclaceae bacterium]|nr:motility-associated protein [Rhodocyclaceae bacterium]
MLLLVGYVIVLLSSIGTYAVHGSLGALWVPLEYIAIFGLTIGYLVASNSPRSLRKRGTTASKAI